LYIFIFLGCGLLFHLQKCSFVFEFELGISCFCFVLNLSISLLFVDSYLLVDLHRLELHNLYSLNLGCLKFILLIFNLLIIKNYLFNEINLVVQLAQINSLKKAKLDY